nr:hypothetical protein GCM10020093_074960 [Planobispora longispora]
MEHAEQVLGRADVDGAAGRQGGADAVGADHPLAPVEAVGQADLVGAPHHPAVAVAPEHPRLRVGDDEDVGGLVGHAQERPGDERQQVAHRVGRPDVPDVAGEKAGGAETVPGSTPAARERRQESEIRLRGAASPGAGRPSVSTASCRRRSRAAWASGSVIRTEAGELAELVELVELGRPPVIRTP